MKTRSLFGAWSTPCLALLLLMMDTALATDGVWDGSDTDRWGLNNNWVGNVEPSSTGNASFTGLADSFVVDLGNNDRTVGSLLINSGTDYLFQSSGTSLTPGDVTVVNGDGHEFAVPVIIGSGVTYNISGNNALLISGVVSGSGGLTKTGGGTLTFTGENTYSGGTTISSGTLQIGNNTTTGSITGDVTNNGTLIFNRSNNLTFSDLIGGTGNVIKNGAGDLTFSGLNDYSGTTTVNAGKLIIAEGNSNALANSAVTINTGGRWRSTIVETTLTRLARWRAAETWILV